MSTSIWIKAVKSGSKSITSFNLQSNVIKFINENAKKLNLSKWDFICYLVEKFSTLQEENKHLKFYLDNVHNKDYIKSQIIESEIDLLTEAKYWTYAN